MQITTKAKLLLAEKVSIDERKQNENKEWIATGNKTSMLKYTFTVPDLDGFSEKFIFTKKLSELDLSKLEGKQCELFLDLKHDEFSRSFNPVKVTLLTAKPVI